LQQQTKKIIVDIERGEVVVETDSESKTLGIGTAEAFSIISQAWLRSGWDNKYVYSFTWLGRPIIQLPEDMLRLQEVLYTVKPDVIIETGVAHGGSLIFHASLCKAMNHGRVIGIDIEIRPQNRQAIQEHELFEYITLVEGSSVDPQIVEQVTAQVSPGESLMALLDSCHTKEHVLAELKAYSPLVTQGSYIIAMDGIMEQVVGAPRTQADWSWNNPKAAAVEFVASNPNFLIDEPAFRFNESNITNRVTYWPSAFIKRIR
jgi:cephalosporin hydroxylase